MALPGSGELSLSAIQTEFGGSNPIALSEYYRGGAYVGDGAPNVPTSGAIALNTFYSAEAALVLNITSNTSNYNILTAATAAGYDAATDTIPIIVNVAVDVVVSGSGTYAMRTGVLNASSSLTINISGSINGYTGGNGSIVAGSGSAGGDAVYWETDGTSIVNVLSGAYLQGGGGGGGGGGQRGILQTNYNKYGCSGDLLYGGYGSTGAAGGFGLAGSTGGTGTYGGGDMVCLVQSVGAGGSGGAAGFALRKNSKTVTINNSGTIAGSTA
jgi:hypothetical protein